MIELALIWLCFFRFLCCSSSQCGFLLKIFSPFFSIFSWWLCCRHLLIVVWISIQLAIGLKLDCECMTVKFLSVRIYNELKCTKFIEWWGAGMVICLDQGADLHLAQLMQLPLTVSCFSKIQIGFTFLVPAHPGSPGKRAVKRVCVCVCVCKFIANVFAFGYYFQTLSDCLCTVQSADDSDICLHLCW